MLRHDGEYRWMLARGMPRVQSDGTYAGYIGCLIDVTEQRSALLDLQKQKQCTVAIAEASGAMYLILDPEGRIEQVSPVCQRLSERDPLQMYGRFIWEVCHAAAPEPAVMRDAIRQAASGRAAVRVPRGNVLWTLMPILAEHGELRALVASATELGAAPKLRACNCCGLLS